MCEARWVRRLGGGARRRLEVEWVSFSYSTEVLRGTLRLVWEPDAQALFGLPGAMSCEVVAAWLNAAAMLTEVSLTAHFSGWRLPFRDWSRLRRA